MGKRSNFPKIPRDFVPTPLKAVEPLIPHLRGIRTFAEPCCGDGRLVRHLESFGLRCTYAGDIHDTGQDALDLTPARINGADELISNPALQPHEPRAVDQAVHLAGSPRHGCCFRRTCLEPVVRNLHAFLHRHRSNRPCEMDRGDRAQQHKPRLVQVRRWPHSRTNPSRQYRQRARRIEKPPTNPGDNNG